MADPVDIGNDRAEQQLGDILAARPRPAAIVGSANCLHCGEAIQQDATLRFPKRWCDSDCRDDWEKKNPQRKTAVPREALIVSGHVNTQIRTKGVSGASDVSPHGFTFTAAAERDAALFALKGHR